MKKLLEKIKSFFKTNSEIITPTAVLAIICIIVTLALSSANLLTKDRIAALNIKAQNEAMSKLIEADTYTEHKITVDSTEVTYHTAEKDNNIIGYVFITEANGYGGAVSVMTAVDTTGKVIAVEILEAADETPGLGQNITKEDFYGQFTDLKSGISVIKGGTANKNNNEIDAVTGATISSKAVTAAVNQALDYADEIMTKGEDLK